MTWREFRNPQADIKPLRMGLDSLAKRIGMANTTVLGDVQKHWIESVGDQVAAHVHPLAVKKNVLVVQVDDKRWATQFKWMAGKVVANLATTVPQAGIETIEVRQTSR